MFAMEHDSSPDLSNFTPMLSKPKQSKRQGVAATEFALVLPIMLIITFATLEICQVIFLKEKAVLAAHEGARAAIRKMTTESQTKQVIRDYLQVRGIDMSSINSSHTAIWPKPELAPKLTPVNVRVRVPIGGNTLLPNSFYTWFSPSNYVESIVVMYKDFPHPAAPVP